MRRLPMFGVAFCVLQVWACRDSKSVEKDLADKQGASRSDWDKEDTRRDRDEITSDGEGSTRAKVAFELTVPARTSRPEGKPSASKRWVFDGGQSTGLPTIDVALSKATPLDAIDAELKEEGAKSVREKVPGPVEVTERVQKPDGWLAVAGYRGSNALILVHREIQKGPSVLRCRVRHELLDDIDRFGDKLEAAKKICQSLEIK